MRRRLTYANVTSTLALFVALGGASYAATQLPAGSVGTKQLKAHAVTASKLAPSLSRSLRLHCRRGTRPALGVCFEPSAHSPASFYTALDRCEGLGGRLPTLSEMEKARDVKGLLPTPSNPEMTGDGTFDSAGGGREYLAAPANVVGFAPVPTSTPTAYRCVFAPAN